MMGLIRFLNLSDVKKGIKNPRKAYRAIYQDMTGDSATSVDDTTLLDDKYINVYSSIFDKNSKEITKLISEMRQESVQHRLTEVANIMEQYPFQIGGAKAAGEMAYLATRICKPDTGLEIGVANGVSTYYILTASEHQNNELDFRAIDKPMFQKQIREKRGKRGLKEVGGIIPDEYEAGWIAPRSLRNKYGHQYYVGDFNEILPSIIEDLGPLDLALYDASKDKEEMKYAYHQIINNLNPGGVLISDDIGVNSAFEVATRTSAGRSIKIAGCGMFRKADNN